MGNRLDTSPELLFTLRNVDHLELVSQAVAEGNLDRTLDAGDDNSLAGSDLGEMFGIDLDESPAAPKSSPCETSGPPSRERLRSYREKHSARPSRNLSRPRRLPRRLGRNAQRRHL